MKIEYKFFLRNTADRNSDFIGFKFGWVGTLASKGVFLYALVS